MKLTAEQIFGKNTQINGDKTNTLVALLIDYIKKANNNDIMPSKKDVSSLLGISIGTVQNAYRMLEDKGFVKSKQKIGTIITSKEIRKQSSKKDCCIKQIVDYIKRHSLNSLEDLPSARTLAKKLNTSLYLVNASIYSIKSGNFSNEKETITLVKKIEKDLETYIEKNCKAGDNIPSLKELSNVLNVSVKTVHDAIKELASKKILSPHRGKYGTTVIKLPSSLTYTKKEDLIFAPAQDAAYYFYEKVQNYIKTLIINNYEIGSKLPSIKELSLGLNVNPNTVRRALKYLQEDGYVTFERGRYGGTIVTNIPEELSYKWLAVNPEYVEGYN